MKKLALLAMMTTIIVSLIGLNSNEVSATGSYWKSLELTPTAASTAPTYYGEGHQYMRSLSTGRSHSVVYGFGDMAGIRRSDDFGDTWYHVKGAGANQYAWNTGAVDPEDSERFIAVGHSAWLDNTNPWDDAKGIYLSTDGGDTLTLVANIPTTPNDWQQRTIAYERSTLSNPSSSRTWWYMACLDGTSAQLYKSTDGGSSWSTVGASIVWSKFKKVWGVVSDPATPNKLYLYSETGLWMETDGGINGASSWVRVGTGLPTNQVRSFAISGDGTKLYASVEGGTSPGVWTSQNSGSTWTNIYSAQPVKDVAVDFRATPDIIYVRTTGTSPANDMIVSQDAGSTWINNIPRTAMVGYSSDPYYNRLGISGNYDGMLVNPIVAGQLLDHVVARFFKTENKGSSFHDSNKGYTGVNTALQNQTIFVDPSDASKFVFAAQDLGAVDDFNYGEGMTHSNITKTQLAAVPNISGTSRLSGTAMIVLPSGRKILAVGGSNQGLFYKDSSASVWSGGTADAAHVDYINYYPTNPSIIAAGPYKSTDSGVTWTSFGGYRIMSMHPNGTGFFLSGNNTVYKSTNWQTSTPSFTPFYQLSSGSLNPPGLLSGVLVADPHNANAIYTRNSNKDFVKVVNTGSTFASATVTSLPLRVASGTGISAADFSIASVAADYNVNGLVYATIAYGGVNNIWRGQITGSSITWTDITNNAPTWPLLSINVHPETGDVIIGGGEGVWVLPPPTGYSAAHSIWNNLPDPVN